MVSISISLNSIYLSVTPKSTSFISALSPIYFALTSASPLECQICSSNSVKRSMNVGLCTQTDTHTHTHSRMHTHTHTHTHAHMHTHTHTHALTHAHAWSSSSFTVLVNNNSLTLLVFGIKVSVLVYHNSEQSAASHN